MIVIYCTHALKLARQGGTLTIAFRDWFLRRQKATRLDCLVHNFHSDHNVSEVSLIVTGSHNYFQSYQESFCLNLEYYPVRAFYRTGLTTREFISENHKSRKQ